MTENPDEILSNSNGYKDKSLIFTKDLLAPNGCDGIKDSLPCETKERNEFWNIQELDDSAFFEDISRSNKHELRASPLKDDLNEDLSNLTSSKRHENPFACDTTDRDHPWSIPEFDDSMIVNFLDGKETGAVVSNVQFTSVSELFDTDTHLYTDKDVVECKLPGSTICYKENNYNIMKDICMDEGVPLMDKIVTESRKDDQPDSSVSVAADENQPRNTREGFDSELVSADEPKASLVASIFKISVDDHTTKEDEDTKSLVPNGFNPFVEDNNSKDADKDYYLVDMMKIFGSNGTTIEKATNISEKESDIQNSKESNFHADQSAQQPDQMPSSVEAFNSQNAVSTADETNYNGPAINFSNNSKSEAGAVTCDFNLTELASISSMAKTDKNLPEQSLRLEAVSNQKDGNSDSFSAATQVHFTNSVDSTNSSSIQGKSLDNQNVANLEYKNSGNPHLGVSGYIADGEASFSAAGPASGLITYSGPISHSANISLRSDSSTTSARSFAFPVLQSEWNSSPVRMAHAERRKHRGWRQRVLCCKF
ncbi:putative D-aminoacyl-tRNA deacylase-like [Capsicum annuum]|uniref:uncharacterized protein LOC107870683 n=1 Tax=Capsicum annuum TaxID=4072 RepID=UPI0007BFC8C7|nr:uncharacterized protein LOC107870683 [Capsicum annuum]XP_016572762.1 uncharacterized protein LOC107870683 [Capsicum annuum]XP_016572763.1 uncharacterized protein LOC107870683 [Capsicum annuum]XP_016572764.1 uncharacterized protein LOC107870683 [Capsicum annuum]XP_016572766.1 uncharacterized protein LOC107870683 [Capsicum annuum]XP_016572768.1 uncharacterized protein LOC107870683 [Capsicum annuum]KAF3632037.1 putative D-aminoacyl-tRNA deacylase-like [Capsicum annuum]KAF3672893.1 putative D